MSLQKYCQVELITVVNDFHFPIFQHLNIFATEVLPSWDELFYILRIFCAEYMKLLICKTIPGKNIVKIFSNRFCASPLSFPTDLLRSSSKAEALKIHHLLRPGSFVFFLRKKEIKLDIGVFSLILLLQYWHNEIILSI